MRFLPSNYGRAAAEVLLTTAIVAFMAYDLVHHSSVKPEATSDVVLSFEAKRPSTLPVLNAASSSSRFDAAVTGITTANTFTVCGNGNARPPSNPWRIGSSNGTNQALIIQLGGGCIANPAIQFTNSTSQVTSLAAITVASGSWLSFQNIQSQATTAGATSGALTLASGSFYEISFSASVEKNQLAVTLYPLLLATGACPDFVNGGIKLQSIQNCPTDSVSTGSYSCAMSYASYISNGVTYCALLSTISGPLSTSSDPITFTFNRDCGTFSPAMFKTDMSTSTGVSEAAVNIINWQCSSITVTFTILGSNTALINSAVASILVAAAPGGTLYATLGGITIVSAGNTSVSASVTPTTLNAQGYYPVTYCSYYPCPSTQQFTPSSSNPALFALLTLLVIPLAIFVGLLIYACLPRVPVCEPVPMCPPAPVCQAPAPVMYYEPCATPCPDPCAAAAAPAYF